MWSLTETNMHTQTSTTGANADIHTNTQVHTDIHTVDTQRKKRKNHRWYTERHAHGDTSRSRHAHTDTHRDIHVGTHVKHAYMEDMHTADTHRDTHAHYTHGHTEKHSQIYP